MDVATPAVVATPALAWLAHRILGPAAGEVGEWLSDPIRDARLRRLERVAEKAREKLEAAGVEPQEVGHSVLVPLLDKASLTDDVGLQEKWAQLLATAAGPDGAAGVRPSFVAMLSEMAPIEAQVLDAIYKILCELEIPFAMMPRHGIKTQSMGAALGVGEHEVIVSIENLLRMNLVSTAANDFEFVDEPSYLYQIQSRELLCGTPLGWEFYAASTGIVAPATVTRPSPVNRLP